MMDFSKTFGKQPKIFLSSCACVCACERKGCGGGEERETYMETIDYFMLITFQNEDTRESQSVGCQKSRKILVSRNIVR